VQSGPQLCAEPFLIRINVHWEIKAESDGHPAERRGFEERSETNVKKPRGEKREVVFLRDNDENL